MKTNLKGVTTLKGEAVINATKDRVWQELKEIGAIQNFHPLIQKSYVTTEAESGLGAKRTCELLPMGQMLEEVVEWNEGNSFTMEVIGGKMLPPYRFMTGQIELTESGGCTNVRFTFLYQLKFGVLGRLMNVLMIKPQFKKAPPKYVEGLKNYVESLPH